MTEKYATAFSTTNAMVGKKSKAILGKCVVIGFDDVQVAIVAPTEEAARKAFDKLMSGDGPDMDEKRLQSVAIFDQSIITKLK